MSAAEPLIPRKIWNREEFNRLSPDGLSLELVNGELIDRMGKRPPHVYWKSLLRDWLIRNFGSEYVRSEDPIDVAPEDNPTSEPEPDLIVTTKSVRVNRGANPKPEDLRLVVEIGDTTFWYDRDIKAALYARAGIREYWVLDVRNGEEPQLLIHLEPANGAYTRVFTSSADQELSVLDGLDLCLKLL